MNFVNALNSIRTNLWGVFLILVGVTVALCKQPNLGTTIITGGFALVQSSGKRASDNGNTNDATNGGQNGH